jgi:predicted ATP-binding protein involved in virulence
MKQIYKDIEIDSVIDIDDINKDAGFCHVMLDVNVGYENIRCAYSLHKKEGKLKHPYSNFRMLEQSVEALNNIENGLPIVQYYSPNRHLFKELYYHNYDTFKVWFVNAKNHENHQRLNKDNQYRSPYLLAIESAFLRFFNKIEGSENAYHGLDIYYEEKNNFIMDVNKKPELVIQKKDSVLKLEKLSDGEKMLLVMLGNIVKDLCNMSVVTEGAKKSLDKSPDEILAGSGIVLIDEIELHLHPAWQRNIIPALTATFPNIQFIVSTHSPQVLSNVANESVFILENFKLVEKTPQTNGRDSNSILWEVYGVEKHPNSTKEALKRFYSQLEDDLTAAAATIKVLENMLGAQDEEVIRAKYHLDLELRLAKEASKD